MNELDLDKMLADAEYALSMDEGVCVAVSDEDVVRLIRMLKRRTEALERIGEHAHDGIHEAAIVASDGAERCPTCHYPMPTHKPTCSYHYYVEIHQIAEAAVESQGEPDA